MGLQWRACEAPRLASFDAPNRWNCQPTKAGLLDRGSIVPDDRCSAGADGLDYPQESGDRDRAPRPVAFPLSRSRWGDALSAPDNTHRHGVASHTVIRICPAAFSGSRYDQVDRPCVPRGSPVHPVAGTDIGAGGDRPRRRRHLRGGRTVAGPSAHRWRDLPRPGQGRQAVDRPGHVHRRGSVLLRHDHRHRQGNDLLHSDHRQARQFRRQVEIRVSSRPPSDHAKPAYGPARPLCPPPLRGRR